MRFTLRAIWPQKTKESLRAHRWTTIEVGIVNHRVEPVLFTGNDLAPLLKYSDVVLFVGDAEDARAGRKPPACLLGNVVLATALTAWRGTRRLHRSGGDLVVEGSLSCLIRRLGLGHSGAPFDLKSLFGSPPV